MFRGHKNQLKLTLRIKEALSAEILLQHSGNNIRYQNNKGYIKKQSDN